MGRKGIKRNTIQKDRKKSASEMTEGRKNKNIKTQQWRGNSYAVEGHAVLNAECLHIDGSVCQSLSVLKINVLFFPLCAPCPAISQLLSFLSFFLFVLEFNSLFWRTSQCYLLDKNCVWQPQRKRSALLHVAVNWRTTYIPYAFGKDIRLSAYNF